MKIALLLGTLYLFQPCQTASSYSDALSKFVIEGQNFEDLPTVIGEVLQQLIQRRFRRHHLVLILHGMDFSNSLLPKEMTRYLINGRLPREIVRPTGIFVYQGSQNLKEILRNISWTAKTNFIVVKPCIFSTDRFFIESFKYQRHRNSKLIITEKEIKNDFDELFTEDRSSSLMTQGWNDTRKIMQDFWKERIQNLAVLVPQKTNAYFYTFFPFSENHCQDEIVPTLANVWFSTSKTFYKDVQLFSNKTEDLFGCPLNISVLLIPPGVMHPLNGDLDGVEGKLIMEFLKRVNATLILNVKLDSPVFDKFSAIDSIFRDLVEGEADIGAGLLLPMPSSVVKATDDVNFGITVCLSWAVPNQFVLKPPLQVMLDVFSTKVWQFGLYTLMLSATTYGVLLQARKWSANRCCDGMFQILSIAFGKSTIMPKENTLRMYLTSFLLFSFLFSTIYQAGFGSNRLVLLPIHRLKTTKEVLSSPHELTGSFSAKQILERKCPLSGPDGETIRLRPIDIENGLLKVAYEKRTAFLGLRLTVKYVTRVRSPELRNLIYLQEECLIQYHPSISLKPSSPYTRVVEDTVNIMVEAGFVDHYMKRYMSRVPRERFPKSRNMRRRPSPRSLESADFDILKWGLVISFMVFLGEHAVFLVQQKMLPSLKTAPD